MFSKAFHHLVQYSDELQNDLRPTIHCEVLNSLERLHIHRESATTYRSPALFGRVDFSPPISTKSHMKATIDAPYDPLACLRERHAFSLCPDTVANESMTVSTYTFDVGDKMLMNASIFTGQDMRPSED